MSDLGALADEDFCYLTTLGRVTGRPHTIEIWFAIDGRTLYMLSGGRAESDWVKNLQQTPEVEVSIAGRRFEGNARLVQEGEEDELARRLLVEKYESTPGSLSNWRRTALPVAVELVSPAPGLQPGTFQHASAATRPRFQHFSVLADWLRSGGV